MRTKAISRTDLKGAFAVLALALALSGCAGFDVGDPETQTPAAVAPDVITSEIALLALGQLGVPYVYGGSTPARGFDCSGLVNYVYREATGIQLPRTTEELAALGERISQAELNPGDLVFYNTLGRTYSHVGIYLGEDKFVHAPSRNGVVRVEDMRLPYWRKRYTGARRLALPGTQAAKTR